MRPTHITCACGTERAVPRSGRLPTRCIPCQKEYTTITNRARALDYSRRPDIIKKRKQQQDFCGHMSREAAHQMALRYAPSAARSINDKDWKTAVALLLEQCQKSALDTTRGT